ncbi:ribosomal protection-like ABC-F family protein [Bacillus sp. REN16]|uniref:ribosomal protection-like ABC-F family protein n=1 Tax=Bacillus sp. REN16 TaxID=2887296 RepID=UPI001E40288B|nr:ABC-F type ribosomal protection protein [Bacillus sp. REN16]MCC3358626.1 ABC-F type ribosomal protection protein [Bacillus sp. REN16]
MTILKLSGIHKIYGDKVILNHIEFDVQRGDRIGIVGNNGAGKTTIANILTGKIEMDKGNIEMPNGPISIGYVKQSAEDALLDLENAMIAGDILEQTSQLGLTKVQSWDDNRGAHLSGGEKTKLSLAKVWASKSDLLLLDEPTNHLDFKGVEWLIEEMKVFPGAIIVISHDRYFLDQTVSQIIEIEDGESFIYQGNYTHFYKEKERLYQSQLHHYDMQQKHKDKIENQMSNLQNWSDKAHRQSTKQEGFKEFYRVKAKKMDKQIKSKMKRLEKELEKNKVEKPKEKEEPQFHFKPIKKRGKRIVEVKNGGISFGERLLFHKSHFYVTFGERIGILGENGCGKTTLLRVLTGESELSAGELWKSHSLKIGYLSQDVTDLDETMTTLGYLGLTVKNEISGARTIFANIGFNADKINQPISSLSLGERTRVKLVKLLLDEVDLLLLDEPTNHLDLASRESFEKMLQSFDGTILTVSHDYYFLEKMCDKLLVFENHKIKRVEMGLGEYQQRVQIEPVAEQNKEEEKLLIDNEISATIGQLSLLTRDDPKYNELDKKLLDLMKKKREL